MYTINFPAIAPSAAHNFSVKTIEFKMAAVSVKRSIHLFREIPTEMCTEIRVLCDWLVPFFLKEFCACQNNSAAVSLRETAVFD